MALGVAQWDDLLRGEELAYLGSELARDAITAPLPDDLPAELRERLEASGVSELYSHQTAAWDAAQRGENVAITTGTASGKSLAFNLLMGRRWPAYGDEIEEAIEVCRQLGLGELLDRMPAGIFQMVGETGWQLSHGERNRVFLARTLLQNEGLTILDESFEPLDSENAARAARLVLERVPSVVAISH